MFEVACGNCQGRLLVQQAGVVVACPHCGTHLTIGAPPSAPPPPAPVPVPAPAFVPPPQPQYAPPPSVPQPAAQQPFVPVPQPQSAPAFQPPSMPAPQPQYAPHPQPQFVAVPPAPAPAFVPQPAAESPAFFAPPAATAEPTGFDFSNQHPAVEPSWMTPAEAAPQVPAPEVPTEFAVAPSFMEQPAVAPQPFAASEPAAATPFPGFAPESPAPTVAPSFAPSPASPYEQPVVQTPAPAWASPETQPVYAPAPQMAPNYQQQQTPPSYQPVPSAYAAPPVTSPYGEQSTPSWYGSAGASDVAPGMTAAFGAAAMSASDNAYGVASTGYSAPPITSATTTPAKAPATVSRGLFFMAVNYASIVTLIAIYLFMNGAGGGGGASESPTERIPDVEPAKDKKTGKLLYQVLTPTSLLAAHQILELGQTKRFGNIEVTPTKVSTGRIEFTNLQGNSNGFISPPCDVMKLHLTFKNVSKDQAIAPLRSLAFRQQRNDKKVMTSNIFVCPHDKRGRTVLAYELNEASERIKGLDIDRELKPGESCELFIPTASIGFPAMLEKNQDFVWRVQFRKGYGPRSFGVTTLIEVKFSKDKVSQQS